MCDFKFKYQKDMYTLLKSGNCTIRPRRSGKTYIQRLIILKILENRFKDFSREEFEFTERKFSKYLIDKSYSFVCSNTELNRVIDNLIKF